MSIDKEDPNPRLGIGNNMPPMPIGLPTAEEIVATPSDEIAGLQREAEVLHATFLRMPTKIPDAKVYGLATTLGVQIQKLAKKIDDKRKLAKRPYLDAGNAVDALYDLKVVEGEGDDKKEVALGAEIKEAHKAVKKRLGDYDTEQYRIETAARTAELEELATAAAKDGIVIDQNAAAVSTEGRGGSVRSEHGGLAVKQIVRNFIIKDPSLVPAQYCSPDPAKIKAAIDGGAVTIPGIDIEERVNTHVKGS